MNPNFLPSHGQSFCQGRSGRRQVKSPGYVWCGGIDDQRILISAAGAATPPLAARRGGKSYGPGGVKLGSALHIHWLATLCSHNWALRVVDDCATLGVLAIATREPALMTNPPRKLAFLVRPASASN
jgi:hypothetical protein